MFKSTRKQLVAAGFLSVVVTLGCDDRMPTAPTVVLPPAPAPTPSVAPPVVIGVTPNKAPTAVPTLVAIFGQRFHPESTVTFGGVAGSVVQMTETGLTVMAPAHEAGIVEIAVTNPDGLVGRLAGRFTYEVAPTGAPSIEAVSPTLGVTTGGTWVEIFGTGFHFGSSVKVDGVVVRSFLDPEGRFGFAAPPHAAGAVDVVVSNPGGESRLPLGFVYAPPEAFNFNGEWKGIADGPPETLIDMSFTITNNALVQITCGSVTLTPSPAPAVVGGQFSFSGENGIALAGRMLSTAMAIGEIHIPPCSPSWFARKQ